ncbi:MAG: hypothetical protein OXH57_00590 [Ekhidna sp.]|nr:hypothetical protein [Ekhidna sp.]
MRRYRDYLIEKLSDRERSISYLQTVLEEHEKDPDGAALYYGFSAAVEGQGGAREFARKTHSNPQDVANAMSSKDETLIANIIVQLPTPQCEISETEKLQAVKT